MYNHKLTSRIFDKLFRSGGKGFATQRARLKNALLPQLLHTLLVELMFAGKGAQRSVRQDLQADGALADVASFIIFRQRMARFHGLRSPHLRSEAPFLVAILPVLLLTGLTAVMRYLTLRASEIGSLSSTVGAFLGVWISRLLLVHYPFDHFGINTTTATPTSGKVQELSSVQCAMTISEYFSTNQEIFAYHCGFPVFPAKLRRLYL
jgi:hypothetical protein